MLISKVLLLQKEFFAEDVENFMIKPDFTNEALFVRLIRMWFESEDDPGISSIERCRRRIALKNYRILILVAFRLELNISREYR